MKAIDNLSFPQGFEDIHIRSVIKSPIELLEAGESHKLSLKKWSVASPYGKR